MRFVLNDGFSALVEKLLESVSLQAVEVKSPTGIRLGLISKSRNAHGAPCLSIESGILQTRNRTYEGQRC